MLQLLVTALLVDFRNMASTYFYTAANAFRPAQMGTGLIFQEIHVTHVTQLAFSARVRLKHHVLNVVTSLQIFTINTPNPTFVTQPVLTENSSQRQFLTTAKFALSIA